MAAISNVDSPLDHALGVAALAVALCSCQHRPVAMTRPASGVAEPRTVSVAPAMLGRPSSAAHQHPSGPTCPRLPPNATTGAPYFEPACRRYPGDWCWPPAGGGRREPAASPTIQPGARPRFLPGPPTSISSSGVRADTQVDVLRDWTCGDWMRDTVAHTIRWKAARKSRRANRWRSMRRVLRRSRGYGFVAHQQASRRGGGTPTRLQVREERRAASTMDNHCNPPLRAAASPLRFREAVRSGGVDGRDVLAGLTNRFASTRTSRLFAAARSTTARRPAWPERERRAGLVRATSGPSRHRQRDRSRSVNHVLAVRVSLRKRRRQAAAAGRQVASQRQAQPARRRVTIRFDISRPVDRMSPSSTV